MVYAFHKMSEETAASLGFVKMNFQNGPEWILKTLANSYVSQGFAGYSDGEYFVK